MKMACVCITWNRPKLLGQTIYNFERQDYDDCELVVLDDAGQYSSGMRGKNWRIHSTPVRYPNLAVKRNAALALVSEDTGGILNMDDDDIYLPWAVSASAHALRTHQWIEPTQALEWSGPGLFVSGEQLALSRNYTYRTTKDSDEARAYGAQWSFRTDAIKSIGGYPTTAGICEDGRIHAELFRKYGKPGDTICEKYPLPFFIHSRSRSGHPHISEMGIGNAGYETFGRQTIIPVAKLEVEPVIDCGSFNIPDIINPRPWQ